MGAAAVLLAAEHLVKHVLLLKLWLAMHEVGPSSLSRTGSSALT